MPCAVTSLGRHCYSAMAAVPAFAAIKVLLNKHPLWQSVDAGLCLSAACPHVCVRRSNEHSQCVQCHFEACMPRMSPRYPTSPSHPLHDPSTPALVTPSPPLLTLTTLSYPPPSSLLYYFPHPPPAMTPSRNPLSHNPPQSQIPSDTNPQISDNPPPRHNLPQLQNPLTHNPPQNTSHIWPLHGRLGAAY